MPNRNYAAIPDPELTLESVRNSVVALKEAVEVLTRQRQPIEAGAVTWQDLLDLGLIERVQIPRR